MIIYLSVEHPTATIVLYTANGIHLVTMVRCSCILADVYGHVFVKIKKVSLHSLVINVPLKKCSPL